MRKVQIQSKNKMELVILASIEYTLVVAATKLEQVRRQIILRNFLAGKLTYEELLRLKKLHWFRKLYKEPPKVEVGKKDD